jgi:hypothetical protein
MELGNISFWIVQLIVTAIGAYGGAYLKMKGANLAKKEDITELTEKVKDVEIKYDKIIEAFRSEMAAKHHYLTVRYEKEFKFYEEVWLSLIRLRDATTNLRPLVDNEDRSEQGVRNERLRAFNKAYRDFYEKTEHNMPFVPANIFNELKKFHDIADDEASDFAYQPLHEPAHSEVTREYWIQRKKNVVAIARLVESVCNAIRNRIKEFESSGGPENANTQDIG